MDRLSLLTRMVTFFSLIAVATACSPTHQESDVFQDSSEACSESRVETQFLVKWKDGRITVETARDREAFFNEVLRPSIDQIEMAEYNHRIRLPETETVELFQSVEPEAVDNWGANAIEANDAWQRGYRGNGVTVAVIDSGMDLTHSQLAPNLYTNSGESGNKANNGFDDDHNGFVDDVHGYNFAARIPTVDDDSGHGSHVAGIIAAAHNDTSIQSGYVQGVAPSSKIMPLDFIQGEGGLISDAIDAISYAAAKGAKVINASWGGPSCSSLLESKIAELGSRNILFVAASGNSSLNIDMVPRFPASYTFPHMLTVGAIGSTMMMASYSNYGEDSVQLFAPGSDISSTVPYDDIASFSGTSMATPFVAGAAAVLWSAKPSATAQEIKVAILNGVTTSASYRNSSHGRLNLRKALDYLLSH